MCRERITALVWFKPEFGIVGAEKLRGSSQRYLANGQCEASERVRYARSWDADARWETEVSRDEIISQNPISDFVLGRGHELKRAGENFITSGCPVGPHKKPGHMPVTIYPATESFYCADHDAGGSVIDWVMHEKNITVAAAMRELGGRNDSEPPAKIVATYDYTDEGGKSAFPDLPLSIQRSSASADQMGTADWYGIWKASGASYIGCRKS